MTYCPNQWIAKATYEAILEADVEYLGGSEVEFVAVVRNLGTVTSTATTLGYYHEAITGTLVVTGAVPVLGAGDIATTTTPWDWGELEEGTYPLVAVVNQGEGSFAESYLANNQADLMLEVSGEMARAPWRMPRLAAVAAFPYSERRLALAGGAACGWFRCPEKDRGMRSLNLQRLWLLLPVVLVIVVACRAEPTATPTPLAPLPTPVPRTPVLLSPRAITAENAKQVQLLACTEDAWLLLAFSPDSSLLAVTCQGGICLHNARTLACIRRFGHDDAYLSAAFSPDGHLLATGTEGGKVWLWRVADGSVERVLEARNQRFWAVAFSADGTTLVASDLTPEVFVWRVADGSLLHSFKGQVPRNYRPPQPIAVALSPDGALLALKERGEVRVWRTDNGSLLRVLQGPGPATGCVVFFRRRPPAGRTLAAIDRRYQYLGIPGSGSLPHAAHRPGWQLHAAGSLP